MNARRGPLTGYLAAVGGVSIAILATFAVRRWIGPSGTVLFFPVIVALAMHWGYGPSLFGTVLSTLALAYYFVAPENSFSIGADDLVRLAAFAAVAIATAAATSARKNAEEAVLHSLRELQGVNATLHRVAEWPVLVGADALELTRGMLEYAGRVIGAAEVLAIWEADDEPWMYVAAPSRIEIVTRHRPDEQHALMSKMQLTDRDVGAVPFRTEHLKGRVFFVGLSALTEQGVPGVELVAREVGSSLDQLYLAERMRGLAAHQERVRLARDLHDGVLQSLTGIRLQLQGLSDERLEQDGTRERLLAIERAIAIEQRELRIFIEDTRLDGRPARDEGDLAQDLEEMRRRLSLEWKVPVTIQVAPRRRHGPRGCAVRSG